MTTETTNNIIEQYLLEKKLEYKVINSGSWPQFLLHRSPITGEEKWHHFYINARNWMWDDKKAQRRGNWNQFRELYWDDAIVLPEQEFAVKAKEYKVIPYANVLSYAQRLHSGEEKYLMDYLTNERWLEEKTLLNFRIWVDSGKITIPIIDKDDVVVNVRRRRNPKDLDEDSPRYYAESGCKSGMFNAKCLANNPLEVYITEWEFDAMQLWQRGITNVLSVTLGAGYFPQEWVDQLKDVKKIYLCYDNDDAGKEGAKKTAEILGKDRVKIIDIPKQPWDKKVDLSDFFVKLKKTRADFMELVNSSKSPVTLEEWVIKHVSEYNELLRKRLLEGEYTGVWTGYQKFDEIVWWLRKWRVVVWSWLTSVGKTTSTLNVALSLAERNIPSIYITTEMPPIDIYRKFLLLQQKISGKKIDKVEEGTALMNSIDNGLKRFKWVEGKPWLPIYLMDSVWQVTLEKVLEVCKVAKENYWMEVIFIDHLHYFGTSTSNRAADIANITRQIKAIALELDVPIVLLAHLNRAWRAQQRRGMYIPTLADLKDAGAIEQDADQVVFICRDSEAVDDKEKRKSIWKVAKNRDGATWHTSFDFDLEVWFFSEVSGVDYMQAMQTEAEKPTRRQSIRQKTDEMLDVFW